MLVHWYIALLLKVSNDSESLQKRVVKCKKYDHAKLYLFLLWNDQNVNINLWIWGKFVKWSILVFSFIFLSYIIAVLILIFTFILGDY